MFSNLVFGAFSGSFFDRPGTIKLAHSSGQSSRFFGAIHVPQVPETGFGFHLTQTLALLITVLGDSEQHFRGVCLSFFGLLLGQKRLSLVGGV